MQGTSAVTVLLVDDDATNRLAFERMVSRNLPECRLILAEDGETALDLAQSTPPDCAIVDFNMPGMDGIELCRCFKASDTTSRFPILLITAQDTDSELRRRGLEAGADDFLHRPVEMADMIAKIRVMLRMKRAEDEIRAVNRRLVELAGERSRAMHETDERFRFLFEYCSDGVFVFELGAALEQSRFIAVNDVACHWLGYSREELLRLSLLNVLPSDLAGGVQGRIESILQHKQVSFETMLRARDGRRFPVTISARTFDAGPARSVVAITHDVSVAEDVREPLRDSVNRYRILTAQTGQMIYDGTLRNGKMTWGGAVASVTGYSAKELAAFDLGRWRDQVHGDDWKRVLVEFEEAFAAMGKYHIEYRIRHKSGEYRYVEDDGVVLPGEDGHAGRILGTIKDISARIVAEEHRRKLERELQHSQKLESLGVLAGGVAHDFNNILAAIIGLTDMALQDIPKDSETYSDLEEALQAAHRAKELVKQILTFSRQTSEERAPLFLHIITREAMKFLRASLPATIEIMDSVDVHSGAVFANATQMHQVIMNFCTNAAQALPQTGGTIEVRVEDVDISTKKQGVYSRLSPGPYVALSVHDTGHGMEEHIVQRIFDPFFTTKSPGEGTGMGLSVVHGIVASHGGAVKVESRPGHGSTFTAYFPRVEKGKVPEKSAAEPLPEGKETILFVDDEEGVRRFGEALLPRLGYRVTFCANGMEAVEKFEKAPKAFDIVITDQIMPKMTGEEMAGRVHRLRPDIPIILFTGFSDQISEERMEKSGITEIVMKPIIAVDFAKRVRMVLDRKKKK